MVCLSCLWAASFLAGLANAGCYNGGRKWDDRYEAEWHANRACYGWTDNNGRHVQGRFENVWFQPYWESPYPASVCINGGGDYKIIFEVTNLWEQVGNTAYSYDCLQRLKNEIWGCDHGGESEYWASYYGWKYRADTDNGRC